MKFSPSEMVDKRLSSLPARGAWIEILGVGTIDSDYRVAPRKGSVD